LNPEPVAEAASQAAPRLTAAEVFRRATGLHREGRLAAAARLYQMVLRVAPEHVDSLVALGSICNQLRRRADAVPLLQRAIAADPHSARAHHDLAVALQGLGRREESVEHYRDAIVLAPELVEAHNNLGNALNALGRPEEAVVAFEAALALRPASPEIGNNLGIALAALGHHDEAIAHYRTAIARRPEFAEAHNNLGIALAAVGRVEEAIGEYDRAVALRPRYALAYHNRAAALALLGRSDPAIDDYQRALSLLPGHADAHAGLAAALHAVGRSPEALVQFAKAVALDPNQPGTHVNLGMTLAALGRHAEAVAQFERALALDPASAEAHNNLGNALAILQRPQEAIGHYQAAIASAPGLAQAHINLGEALMAADRADEALASFERALALDPQIVEAHRGRGGALMVQGALAESRAAFEQALALGPHRAGIMRSLAELRRFEPGEPLLAEMTALMTEPGALSDDEHINLHFALGKAHADLGDTEAAFAHWRDGNSLNRARIAYDEAAQLAMFACIEAIFTPELVAAKSARGDSSDLPVFILGMPRSGTTLVEQILASHPQVFGAGELMEFITAVDRLGEANGAGAAYPDCVPGLSADQLLALGGHYLAGIRAKSPTAARITDKMPSNFFNVGLIHLALPKARIIHLRRDPVDTCLSCFSRLFPRSLPYSYDLGELGRYYRAYERLMAHWRRVLPADAMLDVQYEALVDDFEPQARRIVAYCGLEWDDACARFYETERVVRTASFAQVRRPIYRDSIGRWRPYEPMLQPLLAALGRG
jgi:tetratricopeptide (TPR) repeat protein